MKKKAFALVFTLWIVAMMSLVSVLYLSYSKKVVYKTKKLNDKLELIFDSESTIELLKFYIATGNFHENKIINNSIKNIFPSLPNSLKIDGTINIFDNRTVILQDTAGLINIYDKDAISNYLISKNSSIEYKNIIENSISDWLDIDNFSLLNGAEDSYYLSKRYKYGARNENYFTSIEEFFLLRGMDKYNNLDKYIFYKDLFLSSNMIRNILTIKVSILGKIYGLTQNEIEQLIESKKEGNEYFLSLFYRFNIKNIDIDRDGTYPSQILKIIVNSTHNGIDKNSTAIIDFRASKDKVFNILEYYD